MADAERELRIVISGKNLTGPEFDKARQAIAGVKRETTDAGASAQSFAGTLKGLGPVLAGAFTVQAVTQFAGEIFDTAGKLVDLSHKTGIGVEALQRFSFVAAQGGSSLETYTGAIFKLQLNLQKGTAEVREAAEALGLPYQKLRAMKPEDQFDAVAQALGRVENAQERNSLAVALFGKGAAEILPGVVDGYLEVRDAAVVASEASILALDAAGDRWEAFKTNVKQHSTEAVGSILLIADQMGERGFLGSIKHVSKTVVDNWNLIGKYGIGVLGQALAAQARAQAELEAQTKEQTKTAQENTAVTRDWAGVLTAAKAQVAGLDAEQRKQIQTAMDAGASVAELKDEFGLSEKAIDLFKQRTRESTTALAEHKRAAEEQRRELARVREEQDRLFGRDTIARAKELVDLIGPLPNVWQLTDEAVAASNKTLQAALAAYERLGLEAPASVRQLAEALKLAASPLEALAAPNRLLALPAPNVPKQFAVNPDGLKDLLAQLPTIPNLVGPSAGRQAARAFGSGFASELGPTLLGAFQGGGNPLVAVGSMAGQQLGQSLSKNFGGALTGALGPALGGAISSMLPGIGALAGPLVGKLVDAFTGGQQANRLRDSLKEKFGDAAGEGLAAAVDRLASSPAVAAAYERFMHAGNKKDVEAAWKSLSAAMAEAEALLAKTGLSMDDLRSPEERLATATRSVSKDLLGLKDMGFSTAQAAKGLSKELNDVFRQAMEGKLQLPESLKPYIVELAKAGLLAEDLAAKVQGVPEKVKAPWKEMQAAAEEFGLTEEQLGVRFREAKLIDGAEELASKWDLLVGNGADVGATMEAMKAKAQSFVDASRKGFVELPESMRPMLQSMIDAGLLLDENGEKLTDLGDVKFAKSLKDEFDPLVQALNDLVGVFRNDLPDSIDALRTAAGREIVIPVRTEYTGGNPDDGDGDGVPNQYDNYPDDPTAYGSGGIASGRQVAILAEHGQREIVGDVAFMTRALTGAVNAAFGVINGRVPGGGVPSLGRGEGAGVALQISIGGREIRQFVVESVGDALARREILVPKSAVVPAVSRW